MKYFILLLFSCLSFGQTVSEKWNSISKRYEYFGSDGSMIGYKYYDNLQRAWVYTEVNSTPTYSKPRQDENFEMYTEVALAKQRRYNYNQQRIQKTYDNLCQKTSKFFPRASEQQINEYNFIFYDVYVKPYNNKGYDLSIDTVADNIITDIVNSYNSMIRDIINEK